MSDDQLRKAVASIEDAMALIDRLHRRVLELEAEVAILRGTLERQAAPEEPTRYEHDVPPSAPR